MKLTSKDDLRELEKRGISSLKPRGTKILVGLASCGKAAGANQIFDLLQQKLDKKETITLSKTGCLGFCSREPLVEIIRPNGDGIVYQQVDESLTNRLIDAVSNNKKLPSDNALGVRTHDDSLQGKLPVETKLTELDFYSSQHKVVLRNCGVVDPLNISEYVATGGYKGLWETLNQNPAEIIDRVKKSGLRGRGGAGFPTGKKWEFARQAEGEPKYLICNADEGDPGAYMDRSVLESDPFSVIEGMTIGGYAIGASQGYIYVRAEYPVAIARLENAISTAKEKGLLGKNVFGQDFDFNIIIKKGAGAFVCGEETALIASIESKRGMPRPRPPFPAQSGLWGQPTNINNVETWANIPVILDKGPQWFSDLGTEQSKGTKIFSLTGKIANTGLVEIPMGTAIDEIVYRIGGAEEGEIKAVQTGGPSGGCIPKQKFDIPVDYESLQKAGSIMGSGGMIVMDRETCMVDVARFFLSFIQDESCGKCTPCRIGTQRLLEILEKVTSGNGNQNDLEELESLSHYVKDSSLCGLGQTAPNPILSTLQYFRDEYEAHLQGKCPAGVCFDSVASEEKNTSPLT